MLRKPLTKTLTVLVLLLPAFAAIAQKDQIDFGQVTRDELAMKECAFDKSADAVVLLDYAVAYFNDQYNLITERRIRLKILKERGIERANIRIPYYSNEGFETIRNIEGVVITPTGDGGFSTTALERKNIFNQQINSLYSLQSFAMPNVKIGSIIDYKYQSIMKSYGGLKQWEFQKDIPVVTSFYELSPIPNSEFVYSVYKAPTLPIDVNRNEREGKVTFIMNNVPGLRDEVYSATTRSFLQRVNFQFASHTTYMGKTDYTNTWQKLANELLQEREFGSQANKDLSGTSFIKSLSPSLSAVEKLQAVYDFVRSNITWTEINSKYSEEGSKNTLEKKKGNTGEINLLLVSLLKSAGVEAYPLLVCERDFGLVDTAYSFLDQFNKVVAIAYADGKQYVLDGTDKLTPFFLVPPDLVNTTAFLVDKKQKRFVYFNNLPQMQRELITLTGTVSENGILQSQSRISHSDYARLGKVQRFRSEKARYLEAIVKEHPSLKVDSFAVTGFANDSAALEQDLQFSMNLKKTGGYYLLDYNLFTGLLENPFITQYRFTDIDFGTKYNLVLVGSFTLPPAMTTETLPANKRIVSVDRTMSASRYIQKTDNTVQVRLQVDINREKFFADEYEEVKGFFKELVDLLNEPVLLKAK
jgi:transglutaminase-like putative cysteine protease